MGSSRDRARRKALVAHADLTAISKARSHSYPCGMALRRHRIALAYVLNRPSVASQCGAPRWGALLGRLGTRPQGWSASAVCLAVPARATAHGECGRDVCSGKAPALAPLDAGGVTSQTRCLRVRRPTHLFPAKCYEGGTSKGDGNQVRLQTASFKGCLWRPARRSGLAGHSGGARAGKRSTRTPRPSHSRAGC